MLAAFYLLLKDDHRPGAVHPDLRATAAATFVEAMSVGDVESRFFPYLLLTTADVTPEETIPALQRSLRDKDGRFRLCAAAALCGAKSSSSESSAVEIQWGGVMKILGDALDVGANETLRAVAAGALARLRLRMPIAIDSLTKAARNRGPAQLGVLQALERHSVRGDRVLATVSEIIADRSVEPFIRQVAARIRAQCIPDVDEAVPVVVEAVEEADNAVFRGTIEGLIERGEMPDELMEMLRSALEHEDVQTRATVAWLLSLNASIATRAVPALVARLTKEPDAEALGLVVEALEAAGNGAVLQVLAMARSPDMTQRLAAGVALPRLGPAVVEGVCRTLLTDSDELVRSIGIGVLRTLGIQASAAGPVLADLLANAVGEQREWLVSVLAKIAPDFHDVAPALVNELLSDNTTITYWATKGLIAMGREAVSVLERAKAAATVAHRQRIDSILAQISTSGPAQAHRLAVFGNDDALELFAWVGHLNGAIRRAFRPPVIRDP
jgi:HEAT repeat protein